MNAAGLTSALLDRDGRILVASSAMQQFLSPETVRGNPIGSMIVHSHLSAAIEGGVGLLDDDHPSQRFRAILAREANSKSRQVVSGQLRLLTGSNLILLSLEHSLSEFGILRRRSEAVSDLAHNVRSSLTTIAGFGELLKNRDFSRQDSARYLDMIVDHANIIASLIDDLATYVYYQSGREIHTTMASTTIANVLRRAIAETRSHHQHPVISELEDADTACLCNVDILTSAFEKVLDNAANASPPDVAIHIIGHREASMYLVVIEDSGPGLSSEELDQVFDPFFSSTTGRNAPHPRMGIGLNVTRYVIDVHGGTIGLSSEGGKGTRVEIRLPVLTDFDPEETG
ncbi:MAG: HAMP domain-containing histidine kinase [Deltaproteobacteria bacterium]|nr:HAMP domain-containing histidine kinase [Deltaproteobacteria bacterium]